jgi:hypothetical protein
MGVVERAKAFGRDFVITAWAAAPDGSALGEARTEEPARFEAVECGVDGAGGNAALKRCLDLMEDGAAISAGAEPNDGEKDSLFESTEKLGHAYIVDMAP